VGIFQAGTTYQALLRFSGQNKEQQNDTRGDVKGLAIKLFNIPGKKLLPGFEDDDKMDIVFNAFPVFVPQNETGFSASVLSTGVVGGGGGVSSARFGQTFTQNGAISAMELANNSVSSQLMMPYYAISPYQFGSGALPKAAVKYRMWPCNYTQSIGLPLPVGTPANYLTVDMKTRLAAREYCYLFQVQFQTDPCIHPINDFLTEWKESDTPFITFATVTIPQQTVMDDNDVICRHAAFNAWRVIDEHRALGSLSRARLFAMMNSQNHRFSLNNVVEPTTPRYYPGVQYLAPEELGINENFKAFRLKTDGIALNN